LSDRACCFYLEGMTNHADADFPGGADGPPPHSDPVPHLVVSLCGTGSCPTIYRTDHDTVLVRGNVAPGLTADDGEAIVEIPAGMLIEAARRLQQPDA
jgi:hypothetical protein